MALSTQEFATLINRIKTNDPKLTSIDLWDSNIGVEEISQKLHA